ncbi:MAG: GGDEF domain-containing protein [Spirochaetes bacterium]|nr:GGDEF domain-containing protein [Spirochaetota bacterium]
MIHSSTYKLSVFAVAVFSIALTAFPSWGKASHSRSEVTSLKERFSLAGEWKITLSDDKKYAAPDYDDSSWDAVALPGVMMPYILSKKGGISGTLWLRKTIHLHKDLPREDIGLILGRIANADETFFNGIRVGRTGEFPPQAHSMWYHPRYYLVNESLVRAGAGNVIAVRVSYNQFCEITGAMAVANMREWSAHRILDGFIFIDFSFIIIAIGLTIMIFTIFVNIFRPKSQEYLFFWLQLLCAFFMMLEMCTYWDIYGTMLTRFKVLGVAWAGVNTFHPIFLHRIYNLRRKKIEIALWSYLAVVVSVAFLITDESQLRAGALALILVTLFIGLYHISCHVTALARKHSFVKFFGFFGVMLVLGAIHDGLAFLIKFLPCETGINSPFMQIMVLPHVSVFLYVGTAVVLGVRFIRVTNQLEDLNLTLELKVDKRTRQLKILTEELEDKNRILSEMALRDSLTGLYNHAAFHGRLLELINESKRHRFSMCVVMIDIDDFKVFNDSYGYQVGDEILLRISDIFKSGLREYDAKSKFFEKSEEETGQMIRKYDLVGRYGGDEFVLILPYCGEEEAVIVAGRMCRSIEEIRIKDYPELKITGSFGIAMLDDQTECRDSKELIALADKALYRAKAEGKNRICFLKYQ